MRFFRNSGNNRGVFPDSSIDEYRSIFTNDDERGADCPCSLEDNPNNPNQTASCTIPNPVISPVLPEDFNVAPRFHSYRVSVSEMAFNLAGTQLSWEDRDGVIQTHSFIAQEIAYSFVICAKHNTVLLQGSPTLIIDDIPLCTTCTSTPNLTIQYENEC